MAGPLQELCDEVSCSVCLDFFRDPVTIAGCGHTFCRACLTHSWGEPAGAEASCPLCRGPAQEGTLRPNQQLANIAEKVKKITLQQGVEGCVEGAVCRKHQEPLKFLCQEDEAPLCLVCGRSREHRGHQEIPLEEASQGNRRPCIADWPCLVVRDKDAFLCGANIINKAVVAGRKGRICQKHQEPLKLFCKEDEALICVVCDRSKEHRDHETLPLDEASQAVSTNNFCSREKNFPVVEHGEENGRQEDQFCDCLEKLKKERENILACKVDVVKESQQLLKQTTEAKQEMVAKFRELHTFLKEQEKRLLAQMEEVEKEVAKNRDQHLVKLSEALSSLDSLMQEMEEKCQQPATELLRDARSTLLSCCVALGSQELQQDECFSPKEPPIFLGYQLQPLSPGTLPIFPVSLIHLGGF
uniref:Uncharacterized protein n=1 Tax=Sphaerodactylus townsendi TaxID=933632 RepID=A0ACB8EG31_9SAUR